MGFIMAIGACYGCKYPFNFNPHKVPSIRINGVREPVCKFCMDRANEARLEQGLPLHTIHPDAYEPAQEGE